MLKSPYFRVVWTLAILLSVFYFFVCNYERIGKTLMVLPGHIIAMSFFFIWFGKLLLVFNMLYALRRHDVSLPFSICYRIYNTTQLAKYVPGSIWQFVGRFGHYRHEGVAWSTFRDSMLLETVAVVTGSAIVGGVLVGVTNYSFMIEACRKTQWSVILLLLLVLAGLSLILFRVFFLKERMGVWVTKYLPGWKVLILQIFIWLSLGFGFAASVIPYFEISNINYGLSDITYLVGLYPLAHLAGFVVPFAPAGLGVREAFLVLGLVPFLTAEQAIVLAGLNRVIYIGVEIIVGGTSLFLYPERERKRTVT